jgi:hypothetical protein
VEIRVLRLVSWLRLRRPPQVRAWQLATGAALIAGLIAGGHAVANWLEARQRSALAQELLAAADIDPDAGFHATIDAVRTFINDHSQHTMDAAFYAVWGDFAAMANGVLAHARGLSSETQHAECSTRSEMMSAMLRELGLEVRTVVLYRSDLTNSHTMLGIRNPQTGLWETQDPDYDIYWRHVSGTRASIIDVVAAPESFVPCGRGACGWDHKSREGISATVMRQRKLFGFVAVSENDGARRYAFYTPSIDPQQSVTWRDDSGTFCEVIPKRCRQGFATIADHEPQDYVANSPARPVEGPSLVADSAVAR